MMQTGKTTLRRATNEDVDRDEMLDRLARADVDERGWTRVTVDPYRWNESAVRAWGRAGFVEVSEHESDDEHRHPWVLMEFQG